MRRFSAALSALALSIVAGACGSDTSNPAQATLTVVKAGSGTGTVSGTGIACGADCSEAYASGTSVTLTATPDAGSTLAGWSGCDTASGAACTLTMGANRTVTATFTAASVTLVSSNITVATTWATGGVYQVTKAIDVTAALTIQPGVVVKFDSGASLHVTGTITADGQAAATPVIFTSSKASPAGGDWIGITLAANGSLFNQCQILYAGQSDKAALALGTFAATVTHCTFAHHKPPTDSIDAAPALDASDAAAGTVIRDNLFFDDRAPLAVSANFSVEANAFDNSAAAPSSPQPSKYNAIVVAGCAHVKAAITWPAMPVPYVIGDSKTACNYLTVDASGQLTVGTTAAGAVVKFFKNGNISAAGLITAHAVFTSIADDKQLGDTNGDGTSTAAAGGDWAGISLGKAGSSFDHSSFLYAGGGDKPALDLGAYAATVTNDTFAHHKPDTGTVRAPPALDASAATATAAITGNTFYDDTVPVTFNTTLSIDDSNSFTGSDPGGTAQTNKFQAIFITGCGHVGASLTWAAIKVPLVIGDPDTACGYIQVDSGAHLTLADQVVVKLFGGGNINVQGVLTANGTSGITFTSFADDAHGGDTNADGAGSAPAGGDWEGMRVSASGSSFAHVSFLYAGGAKTGGDVSALAVQGAKSVSVTNSVFAHVRSAIDTLRAAPALDLTDAAPAGTVVTGNRFFDDTLPLGVNANLSLDDSNSFDSGVAAALLPNRYPGVVVAGCGHVTASTVWNLAKVPLVIGDAVTACNYLAVDGGGHLTLGPAVTLKFFADGNIGVASSGLLTIDATCWLTCITDDHLTDTNGDGSATSPASGDWYGIKYQHSGGNPTCDASAYMHWYKPNLANGSCGW